MNSYWKKIALFIIFACTVIQFQNCAQQKSATPAGEEQQASLDDLDEKDPEVVVEPDPVDPKPEDPTPTPTPLNCTMTAASASIAFKGTVKLTWQSDNAKSAIMSWYNVDGSEGAVNLNGSWTTRSLYADTTFKLTVYNSEGQSKSCTTKVNVEPPSKLYVLGIGQSNMQRYFAGSPPTKVFFEKNLSHYDDTVTHVEFINSAYGGSAVIKSGTGENYWLEQNATTLAFTAGPRLKQALAIIKAQKNAKKDINYFLWAQGEADAIVIENHARSTTTTEAAREALINSQVANYNKGVQFIFNELRTAAGSPFIPVGIQALGQRNVIDTPTLKIQHITAHKIRRAQYKLSSEMSNVAVLANMYDAPLYDNVHMDPDGQKLVLTRIMKNIARQRQRLALLAGPKMTKAEFVGTSKSKIKVTLTNSANLDVGTHAFHLFSIHTPNSTFIMRAKTIKKLSETTLELTFNKDISANAQLWTAFGILSTEGPTGFHYDYEGQGRYIHNGFKRPIETNVVNID
ncbi:MAG: hypothetical protein IT287_02880 [Bdellovibrionaceae bacterium]|nr:hypothetical protein [Pseudobdellovibrionaceae bacterium]